MAGKALYTPYNLTIILILCLGSLTYGYCFSVISNTLGQPNFYTYLNLATDPTSPRYSYTNSITGAATGLFSVGGFFGAIFLSWLTDAYGRKKALIVANIATIIGGALSTGTAHIAMFLIGRLLTGFATGMMVCLIPFYQAELAPPASRGFLGAQHGVVLCVGYAVAGWVGVGTFYSKTGSFQWRFPLAVECLFPIIILGLIPLIPESPRWLLMQGEKEEAWRIMQRLHHSKSDSNDTLAHEEFYQMTAQVEHDRQMVESETLWDLFRKPSYRKRLFIGGWTFFACESTGILVTYSYSVVLYTGLGFSGVIPLVLSAAYASTSVGANFLSSLLLDRVGRRPLIIFGLLGCAIFTSLQAALTASFGVSTNKAGQNAAVAMFYLFVFCYGTCLDATGFVYAAEIFPTHIRSRGMAFSISCLFLSTIPYMCGGGTAFANIGWKFFLVFICITAANVPIAWAFFPETKGKSLEEINEIFGDQVTVHITNLNEEDKMKLDEESFRVTREILGQNPGTTIEQTEKTGSGRATIGTDRKEFSVISLK